MSEFMSADCTRCCYCNNNGACPTTKYREGYMNAKRDNKEGSQIRDQRAEKREVKRVIKPPNLPVLLRNRKGAVRDVHSSR